jgi:hypothetical protein
MTKALVTPYHIGDRVLIIATAWVHPGVTDETICEAGETGTIRQITVSDPNDGDDTFLLFRVKFDDDGQTALLGDTEFAPIGADAWLRRQLATLEGDSV